MSLYTRCSINYLFIYQYMYILGQIMVSCIMKTCKTPLNIVFKIVFKSKKIMKMGTLWLTIPDIPFNPRISCNSKSVLVVWVFIK